MPLWITRLPAFGGYWVALLAALCALSSNLRAEPLSHSACEALKSEHQSLAADGIKTDLARGPEWAEKNLGQLRLQQVARVIEIEEQLAFRCKGTAIAAPLVIPLLKTVRASKKGEKLRLGNGHALRRSTVPLPVRRPAAAAVQVTPTPNSERPTKQAARTTQNPDVGDPEQKTDPDNNVGTTDGKAKLPKVIRLQPSKTAAPKPRARKVQVKKRRRRKPLRDAYVPPPPNPGYQPSLASP